LCSFMLRRMRDGGEGESEALRQEGNISGCKGAKWIRRKLTKLGVSIVY